MMARSTRAAPRPARAEPVPSRPARAKPTPSATPKPDFAKYKDIITDLYWRHDSMPLPKMAEVMAKEHSFFATERQYKRKFHDWGLGKNITKKESEAMYRLQKIRRRQGKESVFYHHGLPLESARLSRSFKKLEKLGYKPSDEEVVLPPTIRCETPRPQERYRVLPNEEEAHIPSPESQPAASPFVLHEQGHFPEHGAWARSLSPQADWDATDDISLGDMLAAPAEADLGRQFSAPLVNHFAFDDPGPYLDFLADFKGPSSSGFGNTMAPGVIAPPAQHRGFMASSTGWETGNYDHHPSQGHPVHIHANGNGIFNSPLHTWPPSPSHPFNTPSFPPFNPPPTPPPHFDLPVPPFNPPPTPPPTFDLPYTWTSTSLPPNNTRASLYQPANPPSPAYAPASAIPIPRRGLGWRG